MTEEDIVQQSPGNTQSIAHKCVEVLDFVFVVDILKNVNMKLDSKFI